MLTKHVKKQVAGHGLVCLIQQHHDRSIPPTIYISDTYEGLARFMKPIIELYLEENPLGGVPECDLTQEDVDKIKSPRLRKSAQAEYDYQQASLRWDKKEKEMCAAFTKALKSKNNLEIVDVGITFSDQLNLTIDYPEYDFSA